MIGQLVSHHKILEKLGEGGMGVVYKAEDTKLKRTVALKFLPKGLETHEPERTRFLQEAQAASALNHPNVCTIYDIREEGDQRFIVMEYVDGKTLRQMVPIQKIQDAITFAIQIGEALQEAHSHGIIHRDVKPENIMVNTKNQVKVMDFGLAKLKGSLKLTRTSSTVGTLAYMSPEQIQGAEVDARSDIFSFGIVLFEMLTGHLPFRGEHEAAVMYSILNESPHDISSWRNDIPLDLQHVLNRMLEKDPQDRHQTVTEIINELQRIQRHSDRVKVPSFSASVKVPRQTSRSTGWWIAGASSLAILTVVAGVWFFKFRDGDHLMTLNPGRTLHTLQIPYAFVSNAALSKDGNWLAFTPLDENLRWDVYVLNLGTGESFRVTNEKNGRIFGVDIWPDLTQIVYGCQHADSTSWEIKSVSFHGGISRTLSNDGILPRWIPNSGRIGYVSLRSPKFEIWGVNADGTDDRLEFSDTVMTIQSDGPLAFSWSPDGGSIAWVRCFPHDSNAVIVRDLKRHLDRQLTAYGKGMRSLAWISNDRISFPMDRSGNMDLWATTSQGKGLLQITQGVSPVSELTASLDGRRVVYDQGAIVHYLWTADVNGKNERQMTFEDVRVQYAAFSPDKMSIAAVIADVDWSKPEQHLYIMDPDGRNRRRLTSGSQIVDYCRWSFDGKWLAYSSHGTQEPQDSAKVYLIRPFEPGAPRYVAKGLMIVWISSEEFIIPSTHRKTFQYSVRGDEAKEIVCDDSTGVIRMPGKDYFIITDRRAGREGVWTVPIDARGKVVSSPKKLGPVDLTVYAPDLSYLLYGKTGVIWKISLPTGKTECVGHLSCGNCGITDVSSDGKEILIIKGSSRSRFVMVENLFQ